MASSTTAASGMTAGTATAAGVAITDPAPVPTGPAESRAEVREQAILDAARDLIADVGYDRMSMDALAARARVSKTTIYRRWPGKAEVVVEAIRRRACSEMSDPVDTGSLRGDLLAAVTAKCDALNGEDGPLFIGLLMAARNDAELAALLRAQMYDTKHLLAAELVRRAVARGELAASTDPLVVADLVPAVLLMRMVTSDHPDDPAYLAHLVDDILIPVLVGCRHGPADTT